MSETLLEPIRLRERGFEVLVQALGWVNAVRFLQQYETSKLDYVKERAFILPDWDATEVVRQMKNVAPDSTTSRDTNP